MKPARQSHDNPDRGIRWFIRSVLPSSDHAWARFLWITLMALLGMVLVWLTGYWVLLRCPEKATEGSFCWAITHSPPWPLLTGLAAAPALLLTWWWRTIHKDTDIRQKQQEIDATKRDERSKRFAEAVKLLADDKLEAKLGGIYLLESLSRDATEECEHVTDTLCAFVRQNGERASIDSSGPKGENANWAVVIQAAVSVIGRIPHGKVVVNLRGAYIPRLVLIDSDFSHAELRGANLSEGRFVRVKFVEAELNHANLSSAGLAATDLSGARMRRVDLSSARLIAVTVAGTDFGQSNLRNASLREFTFRSANLSGVDLRHDNPPPKDCLEVSFQGAFFDSATYVPEPWGKPEELGMIPASSIRPPKGSRA